MTIETVKTCVDWLISATSVNAKYYNMYTELTPKLTATAFVAQSVERWSRDSFLDKIFILKDQCPVNSIKFKHL